MLIPDYHAMLTVLYLSDMDKRTIKKLAKWLRQQADNVEDSTMQKIGYTRTFRAKLMK